MGKATMRKSSVLMALAVSTAILAGCTAQYRNHGYVPPEEDLQQIVPGVDTRATVEELIGVPTTSGVLSESAYYYVGSTVKHFGPKKPEIVDRTVLVISFDEADVVTNIEEFGLSDGMVVPISSRVTTSGSNIGLIRKLFGNIGQLSADTLLGGG